MTASIERNPFTHEVIGWLRINMPTFPVGDGRIPRGGGWAGQPATAGSSFVPFVVVSEIAADHSSGPLGDSQADWQLPYLVEVFGIMREQVSAVADRVRQLYKPLRAATFSLSDTHYGVQQVRLDSLGAPVRVEQVQPPVWHSQDGITLWIGKKDT